MGYKYTKVGISIHAPREGRDRQLQEMLDNSDDISIHAPREGRDGPLPALCGGYCISIHAPREGRDEVKINVHTPHSKFQSTRPARGATMT